MVVLRLRYRLRLYCCSVMLTLSLPTCWIPWSQQPCRASWVKHLRGTSGQQSSRNSMRPRAMGVSLEVNHTLVYPLVHHSPGLAATLCKTLTALWEILNHRAQLSHTQISDPQKLRSCVLIFPVAIDNLCNQLHMKASAGIFKWSQVNWKGRTHLSSSLLREQNFSQWRPWWSHAEVLTEWRTGGEASVPLIMRTQDVPGLSHTMWSVTLCAQQISLLRDLKTDIPRLVFYIL